MLFWLLTAPVVAQELVTGIGSLTNLRPCPALACLPPKCPTWQQYTPKLANGCSGCPQCRNIVANVDLDLEPVKKIPIPEPGPLARSVRLPKACKCGETCTMSGGGTGVCQVNGDCAVNIRAPDCDGSQSEVVAVLRVPTTQKKCECGETCTMSGGGTGVCQVNGDCAVNIRAPDCDGSQTEAVATLRFPWPTLQSCVCGSPCLMPSGAYGKCQEDGRTCSLNRKRLRCEPATACPKPYCLALYCPTEHQEMQYDNNGCPTCPRCKFEQNCDSDEDCPHDQECTLVDHYRQCRPITARPCFVMETLAANSLVKIDGPAYNQCPTGFLCVDGHCRQCPQPSCYLPPCPGRLVPSTFANGCPGCPRCEQNP